MVSQDSLWFAKLKKTPYYGLLFRDAVFRVLAVEQPQAVVLNYAPGHTSDLFNIWRNFYVLIALSDHMIFHQDPLTHPWLRSYLQTTGLIKVKLFFNKFTESNLNPISCSCADNVWGPEADGGFVEAVRLCGKTCGSSEVSWSLVVRLMIQAIVTEFGEIMVVIPSTSEMLIVSGGAISNLATMSTITTKRLAISADHIRINIWALAFR